MANGGRHHLVKPRAMGPILSTALARPYERYSVVSRMTSCTRVATASVSGPPNIPPPVLWHHTATPTVTVSPPTPPPNPTSNKPHGTYGHQRHCIRARYMALRDVAAAGGGGDGDANHCFFGPFSCRHRTAARRALPRLWRSLQHKPTTATLLVVIECTLGRV